MVQITYLLFSTEENKLIFSTEDKSKLKKVIVKQLQEGTLNYRGFDIVTTTSIRNQVTAFNRDWHTRSIEEITCRLIGGYILQNERRIYHE